MSKDAKIKAIEAIETKETKRDDAKFEYPSADELFSSSAETFLALLQQRYEAWPQPLKEKVIACQQSLVQEVKNGKFDLKHRMFESLGILATFPVSKDILQNYLYIDLVRLFLIAKNTDSVSEFSEQLTLPMARKFIPELKLKESSIFSQETKLKKLIAFLQGFGIFENFKQELSDALDIYFYPVDEKLLSDPQYFHGLKGVIGFIKTIDLLNRDLALRTMEVFAKACEKKTDIIAI